MSWLNALGVAVLYNIIAWLGYGVTRSGRKVDYLFPLSVWAEVALGLVMVAASACAVLAFAVGAGISELSGSPVIASAAALTVVAVLGLALRKPVSRKIDRDSAQVAEKRSKRAGSIG